jgi:hypothetical protein
MSLSNQQKASITAGVLIAAAILIAALVLTYTVQIHNTGTINTTGFVLWADQNRTIAYGPTKGITWGTFNPGDIHAVMGWAQNTQNTNITLSYTLGNWNPTSAQQYLVFSWNYTGQILHPGDIIPVQMNLQALANVTGVTNFSFDINMTATQA